MAAGEMAASFWLSLSLTYLAHATLWAAAASLGAGWSRLSFAARHGYWKAALFGPLLSASLACFWSSATQLPGGAPSQSVAAEAASAAAAAARPWLPQLEVSVRAAVPSAPRLGWLVLAASGFGLLRLSASARALRRLLRDRKPVTDARLLDRFEALRRHTALSHVRFSACEQLSSPLVVGRREVCVPSSILCPLTDEDLDAVLAHELAHLERGDGIWFPLVGAVQYALWFQPLNHLVSSHFRSSAEISCDDRAVELTGNPRALGRAIVRMAEAAALVRGPALAPSILPRKSDLLPRVRRLLSAPAVAERSARRGSLLALSSAALVGVALVTISVRVVRAQRAPVSAIAAESSPSVSEQNARMTELAARDQQLSAALSELAKHEGAEREGSPEFTRILELGQELRHVRAEQSWHEARFVATWSAEAQR
jgi:beta-lactamase regulating signal transducer with metallopeptidase domain